MEFEALDRVDRIFLNAALSSLQRVLLGSHEQLAQGLQLGPGVELTCKRKRSSEASWRKVVLQGKYQVMVLHFTSRMLFRVYRVETIERAAVHDALA